MDEDERRLMGRLWIRSAYMVAFCLMVIILTMKFGYYSHLTHGQWAELMLTDYWWLCLSNVVVPGVMFYIGLRCLEDSNQE